MPRDPDFTGPGAGRSGHWCMFLKTTQVSLRSSYVENQDLFFSVPQSSLNHTQWLSNYSSNYCSVGHSIIRHLTVFPNPPWRPSLYLPILWGRNTLLARVWPACPWILPSPALFRTQAHEPSFCLHWCRLNWATQRETLESCESQTARAERGWGWNGIHIRRRKERTLSDPLAQDCG